MMSCWRLVEKSMDGVESASSSKGACIFPFFFTPYCWSCGFVILLEDVEHPWKELLSSMMPPMLATSTNLRSPAGFSMTLTDTT